MTFRRNITPPSSGSKNKPSKRPAWKQVVSRAYTLTLKMEPACHLHSRWFLVRLILRPEDGGHMFLRNFCWLSTDYTVFLGFLFGFFFYPEDGSDMFLGNVGWLSVDCMAFFWFLARLILRPWRWRRCSSETSVDTQLHGAISQKMVRTLSNHCCESQILHKRFLVLYSVGLIL
jgi:hypothetical protein